MILFHGSGHIVEKTEFNSDWRDKDFGYGFYCTCNEKESKRCALIKKSNHIVNSYSYIRDDTMKIKVFNKLDEEWLDFVFECRRGITHDYDIVKGPMAANVVREFLEDCIEERLSKEVFLMCVQDKHCTDQVVFCSERSLSCLEFKGAYSI